MSEKRYLDEFTEELDESEFELDDRLKQKILEKAHRKIKKRWLSVRNIAAACVIIAAVSSFIPSSPVYALRQRLFSFIPGIGVVENNEESGIIKSVLQEPVKVSDGEKFVEIRTAYRMGQTLQVSLRTNVGAVDAGEFEDPADFKEFYSGEATPNIYLVSGSEQEKPYGRVWGGPSYETRIYTMDASFVVDDEENQEESYEFKMEGFNKPIRVSMSPVRSDAAPENIGNVAVMDKVMIFADVQRQGDVVEVLVSAVAPKEYNDIRFHLFDWERKSFNESIHMVDAEGNLYQPDDELQKQNGGGINTFYFNVPQDRNGLKLVVPQILYTREYRAGDILIKMPKAGKEVSIQKQIDLGENVLKLEKASIVPAHDPTLPEEMSQFDCLRIDASAESKGNSRERINRVIPDIEVPDGIFGFIRASYGTSADLWAADRQEGYSLTEFENMEKTKKIRLNLDVECVMEGPWEIQVD